MGGYAAAIEVLGELAGSLSEFAAEHFSRGYKAPLPIHSHVITSATYNQDGELDLTFNGGRTYTYYNVPKSVVARLIGSASPISFFNSEIRGRY